MLFSKVSTTKIIDSASLHRKPLSSISFGKIALAKSEKQKFENLSIWLSRYRSEILIPHDLPHILESYRHAKRNEARPLVRCAQAYRPQFAPDVSERVGKMLLDKVHRNYYNLPSLVFTRAVERGEVRPWHTTVHGIEIANEDLPVFEALKDYEISTLKGFVKAFGQRVGLRPEYIERLNVELDSDISPPSYSLGNWSPLFNVVI